MTAANELCRICGGLCITKKVSKKQRKPKSCVSDKTDILLIFGVDISDDVAQQHSTSMCFKCVSTMRNARKRKSATTLKSARHRVIQTQQIWCGYDSSKSLQDCSLCRHRNLLSQGCILEDTKPVDESPSTSQAQNTPMSTNNEPDEESLTHEDATSIFTTALTVNASSFADSTVTSACASNAAQPSLSFTSLSCEPMPNMNTPQSVRNIDQDTTTEIHLNTSQQLPLATSTPVRPSIPSMKDASTSPAFMQTHQDSTTSPLFRAALVVDETDTLSHTLNKPLDAPLDMREEKASTRFLKRKLFSSKAAGNIVKFKTGGQPIALQKIVLPRKDSSDVISPIKKRRANLINNTRSTVAGPSTSAADVQFSTDLKLVPSERRRKIAEKAGIRSKIKLTARETLALKEKGGLSGRQCRRYGKALKEVGVTLANEHSVRDMAKNIASDFMKVDLKEFVDGEGNEKEVPFGRVSDLKTFVDSRLDDYEKNGFLTWHGTIPENEIWVKIGGDHGKNSFKLTLQIANTQKPNSHQNTIVIAMAAVKDSHENIVRFLAGGLGEDLASLSQHTWKDKTFRVFINGDYEYLCKMFGLSGPQGTHFCLWCLVSKSQKDNTETYQKRNLAMLHNDYNAFMTHHNGDKKGAAQHNNSIHEPLLTAELDHVAPPYLHMLLGIVLKHHKLLEVEADKLDTAISSTPVNRLTKHGLRLRKYGKNIRKAEKLREARRRAMTAATLSDNIEEKRKFSEEARCLQLKLKYLAFLKLTPRSGPVSSKLDDILTHHRITPQAYHSRSFVGNHCNKYLKPKVYTHLTQTIREQTQHYTNDPFTVDKAHTIALKFDNMNDAFRQVHEAAAHSEPIPETSTPAIQASIEAYMTLYRCYFPKKTIPKQHILEQHTVPFIEHHGFGLGFLGEQGTETSLLRS